MAVSVKKRDRIYKRDGDKCKRCSSQEDLTIDHILPISAGGSDKDKNLQTLCRKCNIEKGNKIQIPFWEHIKQLWVTNKDFVALKRENLADMDSKIRVFREKFLEEIKGIAEAKLQTTIKETAEERDTYRERVLKLVDAVKSRDNDIKLLNEKLTALEEHLGLEYQDEEVLEEEVTETITKTVGKVEPAGYKKIKKTKK